MENFLRTSEGLSLAIVGSVNVIVELRSESVVCRS